jgi:hypothetical protein
MAEQVFTAEQLGIASPKQDIFTAEQLGITKPAETQTFTAEQLGIKPTKVKEPEKEEKPSLLAGTKLSPEELQQPATGRNIQDIAVGPDLSQVPKLDTSKMQTEAERIEQEYGYKPEMSNLETTERFLKRAPLIAGTALGQGYLGIDRFAIDLFGGDSSDISATTKQMANTQKAMGESKNYLLKMTEGAASSILQQAPALLGGAITGSEALVLSSMFMQSFGQTYDQSRNLGLDMGDSTGRAAAYGILEVIGEKLGLGDVIKGLKATAKGVPLKELSSYFAKALVKEIPGEQLTYAGQFAVDKGYGLNPEAGIKEFIDGSIDTLVSTVIQGGVMLGGAGATNKLVQQFNKAAPSEDKIPTARELTEKAGFNFAPKQQEEIIHTLPKTETEQEVTPPPLASAEETQTENDKFAKLVEYYRTESGLPRSSAELLAKQTLADEKETQNGNQSLAGTSESSLPPSQVSTEVRGTTERTIGNEPAGVVGISGSTSNVGAGETTQHGPLEQAAQEQLNALMDEAEKTGIVDEKKLNAIAESLGITPSEKPNQTAGEIFEKLSPRPVTEEEVAPPAPVATAPTVTKGKAGRPKAVLTPEQAAEKTQNRKQQQATGRDAIRTAEKAKAIIDEVFDPSEYESIDAAQVALDEHNQRRNQALEDLHRISVDPSQRLNKAGKIAKETLTGLPQNEQDLGRQRHELKQKTTARSEVLLESTNGEDNETFQSFGNATDAINWVSKNGNAFEKFLAKQLAPFLKGVKLVIVNDINKDIPASRRASFKGANGMYYQNKNERVIYLDANGGINNTVFLHEALHGATLTRINSYLDAIAAGRTPNPQLAEAVEQLNAVMKSANRMYTALKSQGLTDARTDEFARVKAFTDLNEFVSYGMTSPALQEFLMQIPGQYMGKESIKQDNALTRFVTAVRNMFGMGPEHESAMQDLIVVTDKLLRAKPETNLAAEQTALAAKKTNKAVEKTDKTEEKLRLSKNSTDSTNLIGEMMREGRTFEEYLDLLNASFSSLNNETIKGMLFTMQTVDILRWKGDQIPGLTEVDKLQQEMSAMRTHMLAAATKKTDKLGAFIRKNGMQTLADAMHTARLEKVSPTKAPTAAAYIAQDPIVKHYDALISDPNTDKASIPSYRGKRKSRIDSINKTYEKWDALGKQKNGHEMYEMVRQFYIDNYNTTRAILNDQIEALPIDDAAKQKLLKSVRLMQEQTKQDKNDATVKDVEDIEYDGLKVPVLPEEYFPFMRYGKYWLRVEKGPTGREFYLFESGGERNRFLLKRAKELGISKDDPNFSAGDDITSLRKNFQDSSVMLQEMFAAIDSTAVNPKFDSSKYATAQEANTAFKEELKDQLYQTYLMTMPERSFRKQFLHSENVTGFTSDVFRNFKKSATSYANQLAKLKYATDITNEVQRARDSLEGMPAMQRAKMELFVNEIGLRAQEEINPPDPGKFATHINQFAFIMLLTSAASSATQMASVPIMVMPSLNAEYGYGASAKAFAKYSQIWKSMGVTELESNGDVTYTAPSIGSSKMLKDNPILQKAFEAALDRHVTTLTNTSVLTNRNRTPDSSFKNLPGTALRMSFTGITALFNGAERMSRELTFMMTFELEYAKSKDFQKAVDKAVDTTHELLGRYDNFNRPRMLRNTVGKTIGQFKMYAVFMTSFFLRNGYQIIRLSTPIEQRAEALHRLTGILTMGGMFHGLVGMPGYSVICAVIDAWFSGDEEERKRRRIKNALTAEDSNLRFRYDFLPEHFGNITVKGVDGRQHRLSDMLEKGPISSLTDINIGSRTSFDGMWFRAAKPGKTYLETAQNYILANLGPGVSTGVNMVGAADDFNNGQIVRGLEKMVPAFFKGSLTAYRLGTEGAETKGGADMLKKEEINTLNLIAATLGFQSSRLARIQEHNFEMQKQITEAQNKRALVLKRLDEVAFDAEKGQGDLKAVFNQIREYNKRYPMEKFMIDLDTIESSLETYAKKRGLTYRGQYMDEKLLPYLIPSAKNAAPVKEK